MKVEFHQNTGLVYLTNQSSHELYLLGKIVARFPSSHAESTTDGVKRVSVDLEAVIKALAGE